MSQQSTVHCSRALQDVHGVHVVTHSTFSPEETCKDSVFPQLTSGSSAIGVNQQLFLQ